jgi:hypothetical protein
MATIAELISLNFEPEHRNRKEPIVDPLLAPPPCPENAKPARKYECEVFNFLLENKAALGIHTVFKFTNLKVDGAILLTDGRRLAIEIKFRMNWTKACQAESEFRRFLLTSEAKNNPVSGGIVFFEEFQGDGWERRPKSRSLENGWNSWYTAHHKVDGYRLDLFRIRQGRLEHFQAALAERIIASWEHLSEEGRRQVIAQANALSTGS